MAEISVVSLNIERSKHLELVIPFLVEKKPDVVALQEVMERDVTLFEQALGIKSVFTPLCFWTARSDEVPGVLGQVIFAPDFVSTGHAYYAGEHDPITPFTEEKLVSIEKIAKAITYADVEKH